MLRFMNCEIGKSMEKTYVQLSLHICVYNENVFIESCEQDNPKKLNIESLYRQSELLVFISMLLLTGR